jgi:hypothetical protein
MPKGSKTNKRTNVGGRASGKKGGWAFTNKHERKALENKGFKDELVRLRRLVPHLKAIIDDAEIEIERLENIEDELQEIIGQEPKFYLRRHVHEVPSRGSSYELLAGHYPDGGHVYFFVAWMDSVGSGGTCMKVSQGRRVDEVYVKEKMKLNSMVDAEALTQWINEKNYKRIGESND